MNESLDIKIMKIKTNSSRKINLQLKSNLNFILNSNYALILIYYDVYINYQIVQSLKRKTQKRKPKQLFTPLVPSAIDACRPLSFAILFLFYF